MLIRPLARPMLATAFVSQGVETLLSEAADPTPADLTKITAAAKIGGGLLLASGKLPRLAAMILAATIVPANLASDMFWEEFDPVRRVRKRRDLTTDISLLGGLLIASADTAGKPSLGWRGRRAARVVSGATEVAVSAAKERAHRLAP